MFHGGAFLSQKIEKFLVNPTDPGTKSQPLYYNSSVFFPKNPCYVFSTKYMTKSNSRGGGGWKVDLKKTKTKIIGTVMVVEDSFSIGRCSSEEILSRSDSTISFPFLSEHCFRRWVTGREACRTIAGRSESFRQRLESLSTGLYCDGTSISS